MSKAWIEKRKGWNAEVWSWTVIQDPLVLNLLKVSVVLGRCDERWCDSGNFRKLEVGIKVCLFGKGAFWVSD